MWESEYRATFLQGDVLTVYLISRLSNPVPQTEHPFLHGAWSRRFDALKRWCAKTNVPCYSVQPVVISDDRLHAEMTHLSAYGQFLFRCKSRSTHMTYSYRGALGCALAHRNAWENLIRSGAQYGLVVEDNVYFGESTEVFLDAFVRRLMHHQDDYLMMHTLGPFADFCLEAEVGTPSGPSVVPLASPGAHGPTSVNDVVSPVFRPMMSTKCYFISRQFATRMHGIVQHLYDVNELPPFHVDAWLSLEALRGSFKAFHRNHSVAATSPWLDNADGAGDFISVLRKPTSVTGIEHVAPVCSKGARDGLVVKSEEEYKRSIATPFSF